jgi:ABC-type multidrug transport system permease subunit
MKLSPTVGLLLYSTAAMLIISVLAIFEISLWGIIGLSYLFPFTLIGILASVKKMTQTHRQKKCSAILQGVGEIYLSPSPSYLIKNRSRKSPHSCKTPVLEKI